MFGLSSTPTRRLISALVAALFLVALAVPVGAAGPPGNNGTVKIHNGTAENGDSEPTPEIKNEPHVSCPFHIHFFFADQPQSGTWRIDPQAPGAADDGIGETAYSAPDGTLVVDVDSLAGGHYKLYWSNPDGKTFKHKTFWVDGGCEGGGDEG